MDTSVFVVGGESLMTFIVASCAGVLLDLVVAVDGRRHGGVKIFVGLQVFEVLPRRNIPLHLQASGLSPTSVVLLGYGFAQAHVPSQATCQILGPSSRHGT